MGTPKRERQKANRQIRLEELAANRKKEARKKRSFKIVAIVVAAAAAVIGASFLFREKDETVTTNPGDTATTVAGDTATTVAAETSTTVAGTVETAPPTIPARTLTDAATPCPKADGSEERAISFKAEPPMCIDESKTYTAKVTTNKGSYTAVLDATKAPKAVNNFVVLARYKYFDGTTCHRIIPSFVVQCGDPTALGTGGPGYSFADELPSAGEYKLGSLAMANSGANTNGSQFFLITGDDGVALPPKYSLFGQADPTVDGAVIKALDAAGSPGGVPTKELVYIESVTISES